jgi:mannose/cellobiose epimerase-like protein (N-acyl-D-glucosamine 2-epimerase family)
LIEAIIRFDCWMTDCALPVWSSNGLDPATAFAERLDFAGRPLETGFRRMRVLARQTAVFNKVGRLKPSRYKTIAGHAWETLHRLAWIPSWGWVSKLGPEGDVIDLRMDLYDQAFGLFALSCRMEATGEEQLLDHALECLRLIDVHLRGDGGLGWYSVKGLPERDQNPHMHYLEALLHLHAQSPLPEIAERIREILGLLDSHLINADCGAVFEHFDSLYWDACDPAGQVLARQFRVWPQCEAIKAYAVHPDLAGTEHQADLAKLIDATMAKFLAPVKAGLWIDRIGEAGSPLVDHVPASTLYHLCEAWLALESLQ